MTLPYERYNSIKRTETFLRDLTDSKKTPRVPKEIRKEAYRCLKHYPGEYYMEEAQKMAPAIFGEWND
jgi:hypothetical protein